jgi:hypothetical protein
MPVTYTSDLATAGNVRQNVDGETVQIPLYIANGRSLSAGDVLFMANIPNGATIVSLNTFGRSASHGGFTLDLGLKMPALTTLSIFGQFTVSATDQYVVRTPITLPYTVSISDDQAIQYAILTAAPTAGTSTNTATIGVVVRYTMPGTGRP